MGSESSIEIPTVKPNQDKKILGSTRILPPLMRQRALEALVICEEQYGRPVYGREVYQCLDYPLPDGGLKMGLSYVALVDLFQDDRIMANKTCDQFTLVAANQRTEQNPDSAFEHFSDRFMRLYHDDYHYNKKCIIEANKNTKVINFDKLTSLLLSEDPEKKQELEAYASSKVPRFLDSKVNFDGARILLGSYPRSGNSYLRRVFEQITGIYTGSDDKLIHELGLQHSGFLGQQVFGEDRIWITKSHWPFIRERLPSFDVDKVVCIVRNPLDVIVSQAVGYSMTSHGVVPKNKFNEFKQWPSCVDYWVNYWVKYHNALREQAKKTPTFFITYEEMMLNPAAVMSDCFAFLMNVKSIKGTLLEERIQQVCGKGLSQSAIYKLKQGCGKIYRQADCYSEQQLGEISKVCRDNFHFFDFVKNHKTGEADNLTQFFSYDDPSDEEIQIQQNKGAYRSHNQQLINEKFNNPQKWKINDGNGLLTEVEVFLKCNWFGQERFEVDC